MLDRNSRFLTSNLLFANVMGRKISARSPSCPETAESTSSGSGVIQLSGTDQPRRASTVVNSQPENSPCGLRVRIAFTCLLSETNRGEKTGQEKKNRHLCEMNTCT